MMNTQKERLMAAVFAGVIALASVVMADPPAKWRVADGGNGHWYQAVLVPAGGFISWDDANAAAEASGGYLATITSADENAFVFDLVTDANFWRVESGPDRTYGPWLGGFLEGDWQWVTGEPWTYTNWHPGQPNGGTAPNGAPTDSLHFIGVGVGPPWPEWGDGAGNGVGLHGYIVEVVPEPATLAMLTLGGVALLRSATAGSAQVIRRRSRQS